jgi:hypothetical protein
MADKPAARSLHERFLAIFEAGALKAEGVDASGAKCELTLYLGGKPDDQHIELHNDTARTIGLAADVRDPGNGMVALLDANGAVLTWVKKHTAVALSLEPGQVMSPALPEWLALEENGEVLVVDGVRVARAFFAAIGTHIPLGSCFRITARDPDGQVHADTVEELDQAAVEELRAQSDDLVATIAEQFALPDDEGNEIPVDTLRRIGGELKRLRESAAAALLEAGADTRPAAERMAEVLQAEGKPATGGTASVAVADLTAPEPPAVSHGLPTELPRKPEGES